MTSRWQAGAAALVAAALLAGTTAAQGAATTFQTEDGSRFILIADPSIPQVHWALASPDDPAYEPPGFEGLAFTTLQVSLHGTWRHGSLDAERERAALVRLDAAWQRLLRAPQDAAATADVRRCDDEARALADLTVFPRVLAAAPVHRPEVVSRGAAAVLVLTTLSSAIGEVGNLLVERREEQPLRELPRAWLQTFSERTRLRAFDPQRLLHTEVLALTMPDQPASRTVELPSPAAPSREQALAVWAATQRPERTVHVLLGDFDVPTVRQVLERTFVGTALPVTPAPTGNAPRALAGSRRSTVSGMATPTLCLAWVMPPDVDPVVLVTAMRWLADGPQSHLGGELQRLLRPATVLRWAAPWPPTANGRTLLVLEASDPGGITGLADQLLAACRAATVEAPEAGKLQNVTTALQHEWRKANAEPRQLAATLAASALLWPNHPVATEWPETTSPAGILALLQRTFAGHPVIVEGSR